MTLLSKYSQVHWSLWLTHIDSHGLWTRDPSELLLKVVGDGLAPQWVYLNLCIICILLDYCLVQWFTYVFNLWSSSIHLVKVWHSAFKPVNNFFLLSLLPLTDSQSRSSAWISVALQITRLKNPLCHTVIRYSWEMSNHSVTQTLLLESSQNISFKTLLAPILVQMHIHWCRCGNKMFSFWERK